jgi:hypothetical protein
MAKRPKYGGRKKGTPNADSKSLLATIQNFYQGYHPVIAMAHIAHESLDPNLVFLAHKEIAKYVAPQLKAIELSGDLDVRTISDTTIFCLKQKK